MNWLKYMEIYTVVVALLYVDGFVFNNKCFSFECIIINVSLAIMTKIFSPNKNLSISMKTEVHQNIV